MRRDTAPPPLTTEIMRSPVVFGVKPKTAELLRQAAPDSQLSWADIADGAAAGQIRFAMARARPRLSAAADIVRTVPRHPVSIVLMTDGVNNAGIALDEFRHANLARSWIVAAIFDKSDLCNTDLRQVRATKARFVDAVLRGATFDGADVAEADFRRADLRGADMRARNLDHADLTGAIADARTVWPSGFDSSTVQLVSEANNAEKPTPSATDNI